MERFDFSAFSEIVGKYKDGICEEYDNEHIDFSLLKMDSIIENYGGVSKVRIKENNSEESYEDDIIKKFSIEKDKQAIYLAPMTMTEDIRRNSRQVLGIFDKLIDNIERLVSHIDDEDASMASSKIILSQIIKLRDEYDDHMKMYIYKSTKNSLRFYEIYEGYVAYLTKTMKDFIEIVVMGVWRGISTCDIYTDMIRMITNSLKDLGVYTADVQVGDSVDFDICTIADDEGNEITDDKEKIDHIRRIQRYPYMFSDDNIILTGKVNVWRDIK